MHPSILAISYAALCDPNAELSLLWYCQGYGRGIISAVGAEVDRLETEIQCRNPGIRFVDLETDRGRVRPTGPRSMYESDFDPGPGNELLWEEDLGGSGNADKKMAGHHQPEEDSSDDRGGKPSSDAKGKSGIHII